MYMLVHAEFADCSAPELPLARLQVLAAAFLLCRTAERAQCRPAHCPKPGQHPVLQILDEAGSPSESPQAVESARVVHCCMDWVGSCCLGGLAMVLVLFVADWRTRESFAPVVALGWRQLLRDEHARGAELLLGCQKLPCVASAAGQHACCRAACLCSHVPHSLKFPPACMRVWLLYHQIRRIANWYSGLLIMQTTCMQSI